MTADSANPRRRPKGDKRERTRAALLDAALALTREQGFERTSLQDIARRAGMTTGAIYGNFRNRDGLYMALAERQWGPIRPVFAPGSSFADKMAAVAEAVIAAIPERRAAAVGALTFRAYALTHAEVGQRFHDAMASGFELGAAWLATQLEPDEAPMPLDQLVRVINALIEGLLFQRFLTPDLMPDDTIRAAFAALAGRRAAEN
ncbi:AcrR family transcriptional regulator [Caulobacter ginsengisoli]|uniref:AcrR family transcriptional regulator n=1 Tax=Caulobacter ginsengisoli TaxID=400775 RepID=A0ABU0IZ64_9CAUL|nr:helix-turn-helix domain-containing protein [Caulobacter ginsengisoli]MDQ0466262.1 AcrR family transcriptional regulator [Caulobacter ginsengisoli]